MFVWVFVCVWVYLYECVCVFMRLCVPVFVFMYVGGGWVVVVYHKSIIKYQFKKQNSVKKKMKKNIFFSIWENYCKDRFFSGQEKFFGNQFFPKYFKI